MLRFLALAASAAAVVAASDYTDAYVACGIDYKGGDIKSVQETNPDFCSLHCAATDNCAVATWTKYQGGTCWLKSNRFTGFITDANAISYQMMTGDPSKYADVSSSFWSPGYDMRGYDIGSAPGANIDYCTNLCGLGSSCWAVTWTSDNGGTCWLKSRGSTSTAAPGAKSMVMIRKLSKYYGKCKPL